MTARSAALTAALLLAALSSGIAQGAPPGGSRTQSSLARRVDSVFAREVRADGPGCAVGVYQRGRVVLARGYGLANVEDGRPITPRTTFNVGSIAKPFTALAALLLEQQGKLSLDDDVRRWIPELPNYGTPIRVRDLLHHASGLRDFGAVDALTGRPIATMPEFLGLMTAQLGLNFPTGIAHEYSHSDFVLLGVAIERVAGVSFAQHLDQAVLTPLGMRGSFVHDGRASGRKERAVGHAVSGGRARVQFPASVIVAGTNLYASVEDLARWDRNFDTPNVGGAAVLARMLSRPTLAAGDTIPYAYGLRLGTHRGLRTVYRSGHDNAMTSEVIRFPDQRTTVATLCNGDHLQARQLAEAVAGIYLESQMRPAPPKPVPPATVATAPNELARYVGVYRPTDQPSHLLPIEVRNGVLGEVLFHETQDDTLIAMTPAGDGRFFEIGTTGNVGLFTFHAPAPGAPPRLSIAWNGEPAGEGERVPDSLLWRPSAADVAEYAGVWFSREIDAGWRLEPRGSRLVLRRQGQPDLTLRPVERDLFIRGFGSWMSALTAELRFHRDAAGRLTHFSVSTPPGEDTIRGLRFVRVTTLTEPSTTTTMAPLRCPCGFVHDLVAIPPTGWMTVRAADSDRFFDDYDALDPAAMPIDSAAPQDMSPQDAEALERVVRDAVGELHECPQCARILWRRRDGEDFRAYAPEPRATI